MWQSPNHKKGPNHQRRSDRNKPRMKMQRVVAEIRYAEEFGKEPTVLPVRLILNDFSPQGIGLFCGVPLAAGQELAITIEKPKRFYIKGRVMWCQEHETNSHIISAIPCKFRIGVEFIFETAEEAEGVKAYQEELMKDFVFGNKVA